MGKADFHTLEFEPCVIAIAGAPYHGKSSTLRFLGDHSNLQIIDVDEIRYSMPKARSLQGTGFGGVEHDIMVTAYTAATEFARRFIGAGLPVAIAGTFSRDTFKAPLHVMCNDLQQHVQFYLFRLQVSSMDVISRRIQERKERGEPTTVDTEELYLQVAGFQGPWWNGAKLIEVETDNNNVEQTAAAIAFGCGKKPYGGIL